MLVQVPKKRMLMGKKRRRNQNDEKYLFSLSISVKDLLIF
jgi:hypothetical protein